MGGVSGDYWCPGIAGNEYGVPRLCCIARNGEDGAFLADGDPPDNRPAAFNLFANNSYAENARHGIWQAGANSVNNVVSGGIFWGNSGNAIEESFPLTAPLITCCITILP